MVVVCRSTVVDCGTATAGAVVSVVTVRVVVVVGGASLHAAREPKESDSDRQAASRVEVVWMVILKPFVSVYSVEPDLASAQMFRARQAEPAFVYSAAMSF